MNPTPPDPVQATRSEDHAVRIQRVYFASFQQGCALLVVNNHPLRIGAEQQWQITRMIER